MSRLFDRRVSVQVDDLLVEGLRVQFKIRKSLKRHANTAEVAIFNLTKDQRSKIKQHGSKVILKAGYKDSLGVIFTGDTRFADHVIQGADVITKLNCGDGEETMRYAHVSESFGPNTSVADVAKKIVKKLDVKPGNLAKQLASVGVKYLQGYTAHGNAAAELESVLKAANFTYSIQDGELQVLKEDEATAESAISLSKDSGLIGTPEHGTPDKKDGKSFLKIKALLQARLHPGGKVQVDSESAKGTFRVVTLEQRGDTHGGDWFSEMEATAL